MWLGEGLTYVNKNKHANVFGKKKNSEALLGEYFVDSIMQKTFKLIISSLYSSLSLNVKVSTRIIERISREVTEEFVLLKC